MWGVEIAFDEDLGLFVLKGSKAEVDRVSEMIKVIGDSGTAYNKSRSYAIRVLWLSNDSDEDSRNPFEPDAALKKSIQKLAELGFSNMKVKMQLLGRCDMIQAKSQCQVEGSLDSGKLHRTLDVKAMLASNSTDLVNGRLSIAAAVTELTDSKAAPISSKATPTRTSIEVGIHLEPKKYYILSATPIDGFNTAFVVQLIEDI
jgi:hypothetical protein